MRSNIFQPNLRVVEVWTLRLRDFLRNTTRSFSARSFGAFLRARFASNCWELCRLLRTMNNTCPGHFYTHTERARDRECRARRGSPDYDTALNSQAQSDPRERSSAAGLPGDIVT